MTKEEKIKLIQKAKSFYLNERLVQCMCAAFFWAMFKGKPLDEEEDRFIGDIIRVYIPEFNPDYLGGKILPQYSINTGFWWNPKDTESRIKAFDKLIELYTK